jgi:hypothetical protein
MNGVFRLAARRTKLGVQPPEPGAAPVSEKRYSLCGAPHNADFERAMIRERTSAGLAAARAEGRIGGRRKKLDGVKRREIAESVMTGRKSGAAMARLDNIGQPTISRIVAQHRTIL